MVLSREFLLVLGLSCLRTTSTTAGVLEGVLPGRWLILSQLMAIRILGLDLMASKGDCCASDLRGLEDETSLADFLLAFTCSVTAVAISKADSVAGSFSHSVTLWAFGPNKHFHLATLPSGDLCLSEVVPQKSIPVLSACVACGGECTVLSPSWQNCGTSVELP